MARKATEPTPTVDGQIVYLPSTTEPGKVHVSRLTQDQRFNHDLIRFTRQQLDAQIRDVNNSVLSLPEMYQTMYTLRVQEIRNARNCTLAEAKREAQAEEERARELGNNHQDFREITHEMYVKMQVDALNCPRIPSNKIPGLTRQNGAVIDEDGFRTGMAYLLIQTLRNSDKGDRTDADNANVALTGSADDSMKAFKMLLVDGNDQLHAINPAPTDETTYNPRTVVDHENAFTVLAGLSAKAFSRTRLDHNSGVSIKFLYENYAFNGTTNYEEGTPPPADPGTPPADPGTPPPERTGTPPPAPERTGTPPPAPERPVTPPPAPERRTLLNTATRRLLQVGVSVGAFYLWDQLRRQELALIDGHLPQAEGDEQLPPWQWFIRQAGTTGFALVSGAFALRTAWQVAGRIENDETLGRAALTATPIVGPAAALFIGRTLYERFGNGKETPPAATIFAVAMASLNQFWERVRATGDIAGNNEDNSTTARGRSRLHQFAFKTQIYADTIEDLSELTRFYREWAEKLGITKLIPWTGQVLDNLQLMSTKIGRSAEYVEHEARRYRRMMVEVEEHNTPLARVFAAVGYLISPLESIRRLKPDAEDLEIQKQGEALRKALMDKLKSYRPDNWGQNKNTQANQANPV